MKRVVTTKRAKGKTVKAAPLTVHARRTPATSSPIKNKKLHTPAPMERESSKEAAVSKSVRSPFAARIASLVLISYFLLVPLADAYADTGTEAAHASSTPSETTVPSVPVPSPQAPDVSNVSEVASSVSASSTTDAVTQPAPSPDPAQAASTTPPSFVVSTTTDASTTPSVEVPPQALGTTTPLVLGVVVPPSTAAVISTTTSNVVTQATETVAAVPSGALVVSHTTDADKMSFSQGECVIVGNGTFQCTRSQASSTALHSDGVFAARDVAGVMQIYYQHNGTTDTITHTAYDNDAPALDSASGDIVWHALQDDRYQIMKYEQKSGKTTELTHGTVNSMLPSSYDGVVVYQTWQGNDWDIVMVDRDGTSHVLTNNDVHDVAPSITDRYITWQSRENNEWVAKVYDRVSGTTQTVHGTEGGKVENPRMVLVFDSKKDNGDIETVGYDVAHNQVVPLSATPAPLPKDIPQPSSQKNDQAFVQSATTTKIEVKVATGTPDGGGSTGTSTPSAGVATSTTLSIPDATSTAATSTAAAVALDASSTPSSVSVAPAISILPAIPDLVIEPYHATDTATTSSVQ